MTSESEDRDQAIAAEFCQRVEAANLLEYLGAAADASPDDLATALQARRARLQAQQANSKYRDVAMWFIKNHAALARVLRDPGAHLRHMARVAEGDKMPLLELALDSVFADGVLSATEEGFVRGRALALGISKETYERVLHERAAIHGVSLDRTAEAPTEGGISEVLQHPASGTPAWWSPLFTRLLLDLIPAGPGEMIDLYCREATSAVTLLPNRRQIRWTGLDANAERLAETRRNLPPSPRIRLAHASAEAIPVVDGSVDLVLCVRGLGHYDPQKVVQEAARVLAPGGRALFVEPDGLAESFIFDRHLTGYNAAFQQVCARVDEVLGALALGPCLGKYLTRAGFDDIRPVVHAATMLDEMPFSKLARKLRRYPHAMVRQAGLDEASTMATLNAEVSTLEATIPGATVGHGGHHLPLYVWSAVKP